MSCRVKLAVMFVVLLGAVAKADRRSYVWTYEYLTMPKGMAEIEYYMTLKAKDLKNFDDKNTWEHQLELEYGLTDHWDISVYQRWQHTNTEDGGSFAYTGSKFRTRYRLAEKGELPVDMLGYFEYILPDDSEEPDEIEAKLVLAKDFGKYNVAYNQIVEKGINKGGTTVHEYATGISYEFSPKFKAGIESTGNYSQDKYYLGPTVSLASKSWWCNVGVLRGLNDRADDLRARVIFGIPF